MVIKKYASLNCLLDILQRQLDIVVARAVKRRCYVVVSKIGDCQDDKRIKAH